MRTNRFRTKAPALLPALVCALLSAGAGAVRAAQQETMRTILEKALDQPVNIAIEKQPLASAFELIGEETGVTLTISPQVVDLLPYGKQTLVSAEIKNISLREGLSQMLSHLGMTLHVRERDVAIEPIDPLRRVCRSVTWGELAMLHKLTTTPYSREAFEKLPFYFQIKTSQDAKALLLEQASKIGAGTMADVLEAATDQLGWTWYPSGDWLVVLTKEEQAERYVDKPVSLRYSHAALGDVLADIAKQAGLRLRMEPGVLKGLPVQTRQNFSLMMQQATIRTALEMISGATGLAYEVTPKEIIIKHTKTSLASATQPATVIRSDNPIVGQISVPIKSGMFQVDFFIREADLSPALNAWRKRKIREAVKLMETETLEKAR